MSILIAAAISVAACSWDRPGHNRYTGTVNAAIDSYKELGWETKQKLRTAWALRQFDDTITITRDGISGNGQYSDLRDMHFGTGPRCATISRAGWSDKMKVSAIVLCADGECLAIPSDCLNVSRVTRVQPPPEKAAGGAVPAVPETREGPAGGSELAPDLPPVVTLIPTPVPGEEPGGFFAGPAAPIGPGGWFPIFPPGIVPGIGGPIGPGVILEPPLIPAVPEAPTWIMMTVALLGLAVHGRMRWK